MVDSDDDMPPPLEDMSEQINAMQAKKNKQAVGGASNAVSRSNNVDDDDGEEIRLVPRKKPGEAE